MKLTLAFALLTCTAFAQLRPDGATASFQGSLPPKPTADLSTEQQAAIEKRLIEVTAQFQTVKKRERAADADIFLKAVRYALEFHEWYDKKPEDGVKKANALLDEAVKRIDLLKQDKTPWMDGSGQKLLGFYSKIDRLTAALWRGDPGRTGVRQGARSPCPCGSGCMVAATPRRICISFTAV